MQDVADKHQKKLPEIKKCLNDAYDKSRRNYDRYQDFMSFTFKTTITDTEAMYLEELGKPPLEFNLGEAEINRLTGEFARQEPSVAVHSNGVANDTVLFQEEMAEGICKAILEDSKSDNFQYEIYRQELAGGFGVAKLWTQYKNPRSFEQEICVGYLPDPTLSIFDPMAEKSHKGDGSFCAEIFPKRFDEVKFLFGKKGEQIVDKIKKGTSPKMYSTSGFNWTYKSQGENILILIDYYERKFRKQTFVQLFNGQVMNFDDYNKMKEQWIKSGNFAPPPPIIQSATRSVPYICRYRITGEEIIDYTETIFTYFPLVFFDGNPISFRNTQDGFVEKMTRPFLWQTQGIQKLMNFAGQTLASDIENIVQHKFMIEKDAIVEDQIYQLKNVQKGAVMMYNGFLNNDPQVRLNPPQPVPRVNSPPEVINTFNGSPQMMQYILGSHDPAQGANPNDLSGIALKISTKQSNMTSMPGVVGFMRGLNQVILNIVDLIPKVMVDPRQISVVRRTGKRESIWINTDDSNQINYQPEMFNVIVEAGVNFQVQQQEALQMITVLMEKSPTFAQFMNEEGLEVLLDNIDIRGIDQLKAAVAKFMQKMQQQQQMQQQMAMQMNPAVLKNKELDLKAKQGEIDAELEGAKINIQQEQAATDRMLALAQLGQMTDKTTLDRDKLQAENARTAVEIATNLAQHKHNKAMDLLHLHHENMRSEKRDNSTL